MSAWDEASSNSTLTEMPSPRSGQWPLLQAGAAKAAAGIAPAVARRTEAGVILAAPALSARTPRLPKRDSSPHTPQWPEPVKATEVVPQSDPLPRPAAVANMREQPVLMEETSLGKQEAQASVPLCPFAGRRPATPQLNLAGKEHQALAKASAGVAATEVRLSGPEDPQSSAPPRTFQAPVAVKPAGIAALATEASGADSEAVMEQRLEKVLSRLNGQIHLLEGYLGQYKAMRRC